MEVVIIVIAGKDIYVLCVYVEFCDSTSAQRQSQIMNVVSFLRRSVCVCVSQSGQR